MKRQLPDLRQLAELVRPTGRTWNRKVKRLDDAQTIWDLRTIAKRRTPRGPFDYTDGAAELEIGLARARQAFEDIELHPSVLRDVSTTTTSTTLFGGASTFPLAVAPTGFTRLMHAAGEEAGAAAAAAFGIPFTLSTLGTTSPEGVRAAAPDGRLWFQLYLMRERERSYELVRRARESGFDTLMITLDTPVAGARHRDKRNGMAFPPRLSVKTALNAIPRPEWWVNFLTTAPLEFASMRTFDGPVADLLDAVFDPELDESAFREIRSHWPGTLVAKGIQSVEDARRLTELGVDGIILSNHGGRQLDRAPVPFWLLPEVVREVGNDVEVHVDTGVMSGTDVVAAVALGARSAMIGRAYLYGLMAGGEDGVRRALEIITGEITRTMKLLGVDSIEELGPKHVTPLRRLVPVSG